MTSTPESNYMVSETHLILSQARRDKAERIKDLGDPIQLAGKALHVLIQDNFAWIAENTHVAKKLDLETSTVVQIYRGHSGPVTTLALVSKDGPLLTGAWDKSIKIWDTTTREVLSTTEAHTDFVKTLLPVVSLNLLISSSSDKIVRFWDMSDPGKRTPLTSAGSISAHTRPVECVDVTLKSDGTAELCTGDTMGVIKVWTLGKAENRWNASLKAEYNHHRTRINELYYRGDQLWTASSDETAQILSTAPGRQKTSVHSIAHPTGVRCILPLQITALQEPYLITGSGDIIRVYEVSTTDEPELISETDAHWHDITFLGLWLRTSATVENGKWAEPWIVSGSLDGTLRRWKLSDLLKPSRLVAHENPKRTSEAAKPTDVQITEEEERELAELLGDSD